MGVEHPFIGREREIEQLQKLHAARKHALGLPPPLAVTGPWQTEREEWEPARQEITSALERANQVLAKKQTGALMR